MMGAYSYSVSRFVPDQIRNEPVNIGAVVADPDTGRTAHKFLDDLRRLEPRCPGADLRSLEGIVKSIRFSDMPGGAKDLEQLAKDHAYSLRFTPPRAVIAPTIEGALRRVFSSYVGDGAGAPPPPSPARGKSPRTLMLDALDAELRLHGIPPSAVAARPKFPGSRGRFVPDRALFAKSAKLALHTISFAARPGRALKDAKVLAVDFEDAKGRTEGLECTAVVDPARGGDLRGLEMHEEAAGHLRDRDCGVVLAAEMSPCVRDAARRLGPPNGAWHPAPAGSARPMAARAGPALRLLP